MKKITVQDIAKEAGVSPATVSRVINHRELVNEETLDIVESAMRKLGYYAAAPSTSQKSKKKILLLNCPQGSNPFYEEVLSGAIASANSHDYYLVLNYDSAATRSFEEFQGLIRGVNASGVILLNQMPEPMLSRINNLTPVVQCCEYNPESALPYVSIDDFSAAQQATNYLIAAGRNKIAFLNGPQKYKYAKERLRGYRYAMEAASLSIPPSWNIQIPEINYDMAYTVVSQLLSSEQRPNAFFAASDVLATAIINAARRYHLRVPEDIMVIGFDNISICQMVRPSITTVNQPKFQLGYTACEILIELISNPGSQPKSMMLATELIVRESTSTTKALS